MNPEEFTDLTEQYRHEFYTYIYRQLWDKTQAEDIFSQGIMTAWEKRDSFQQGTNFRAWVYQILTYKCYTANKQNTKKKQISLDDLHEDFDPEDTSPLPQNKDWLQDCDEAIPQALEQLQEKEKTCLLLRSMGSYSYKEISEMASLPIGTVMTHLHRARKKMQTHLLDYLSSEKHPILNKNTEENS